MNGMFQSRCVSNVTSDVTSKFGDNRGKNIMHNRGRPVRQGIQIITNTNYLELLYNYILKKCSGFWK